MNKIAKALESLSSKEKKAIKNIFLKIKKNSLVGLDLKKLKSRDDIFRVRKGQLRIILKKKSDGRYFILSIERRFDRTYNNY